MSHSLFSFSGVGEARVPRALLAGNVGDVDVMADSSSFRVETDNGRSAAGALIFSPLVRTWLGSSVGAMTDDSCGSRCLRGGSWSSAPLSARHRSGDVERSAGTSDREAVVGEGWATLARFVGASVADDANHSGVPTGFAAAIAAVWDSVESVSSLPRRRRLVGLVGGGMKRTGRALIPPARRLAPVGVASPQAVRPLSVTPQLSTPARTQTPSVSDPPAAVYAQTKPAGPVPIRPAASPRILGHGAPPPHPQQNQKQQQQKQQQLQKQQLQKQPVQKPPPQQLQRVQQPQAPKKLTLQQRQALRRAEPLKVSPPPVAAPQRRPRDGPPVIPAHPPAPTDCLLLFDTSTAIELAKHPQGLATAVRLLERNRIVLPDDAARELDLQAAVYEKMQMGGATDVVRRAFSGAGGMRDEVGRAATHWKEWAYEHRDAVIRAAPEAGQLHASATVASDSNDDRIVAAAAWYAMLLEEWAARPQHHVLLPAASGADRKPRKAILVTDDSVMRLKCAAEDVDTMDARGLMQRLGLVD